MPEPDSPLPAAAPRGPTPEIPDAKLASIRRDAEIVRDFDEDDDDDSAIAERFEDAQEAAKCLAAHTLLLLDALAAARAEADRLREENAKYKRAFDMSADRFARLAKASAKAWQNLADDLDNPAIQSQAEALEWAKDTMLGVAAGPSPGPATGEGTDR